MIRSADVWLGCEVRFHFMPGDLGGRGQVGGRAVARILAPTPARPVRDMMRGWVCIGYGIWDMEGFVDDNRGERSDMA